ncbi:enoyl-[acyl-carrier-protein] reductase [NADH] [Iodidimonas muriae]|uniref:Enoyl-[acyl-carrier-protein] reductase [NADH] n=1 Tax=Iodidimonas muriae TaxID=261467 RepID=A0ABQ2LG66_9PROT|nr:enoyl-ACP reductase FabI [Iodidimonas muriae]GER08473.1 enoyl-[acyl-carrier-protein] reductase [NADH] [Kordiimonadales bacterium JCM 17843]GGO16792.1 enoyl-[acyl-carrier-protein] reductase [NADH] [Iodidimonas muriae]
MNPPLELLKGKKGLIVGIANEHSMASGCAQAFHDAGAALAVTYLNDKARPFVEPVAQAVGAEIFMPLDVESDAQMDRLFTQIESRWGRLDFVLHSIAFCPKADLQGRVVDCSRAGFATAMDISVHSLIRMVHRAEPLMKEGGCVLTMSYYGAEKVVDHYNIMGPVKAALESVTRYLAAELGPKGIRVNALSPGPVMTRAGSGIAHFDKLIDEARSRAPEQRLVTIEEVGAVAVGLVSDQAKAVTGNIAYVDAGYHVMS